MDKTEDIIEDLNDAKLPRKKEDVVEPKAPLSYWVTMFFKRVTIAKHSHGLYYRNMQSYGHPICGCLTLLGVLAVFIYAYSMIYSIVNKN